MTWKANTATGIVSGLVAVAATGLTGVYIGERWQLQASYINPTCASPKGLSQVPPATLQARDDVVGQEATAHEPEKALDGYSGSIWLPKATAPQANMSQFVAYFGPEESTLSISLEGDTDIRLICVNNGLGSGDSRYENWGKVRTLRVWRDDRQQESHDIVLDAQPVEMSESLQEAGTGLGTARTVHLRVINAYAGESNVSHDPDICRGVIDRGLGRIFPDGAQEGEKKEAFVKRQFLERYAVTEGVQPRYEEGCLQSPSPNAGLSEVALFEVNPNDPAPGWLPVGPW